MCEGSALIDICGYCGDPLSDSFADDIGDCANIVVEPLFINHEMESGEETTMLLEIHNTGLHYLEWQIYIEDQTERTSAEDYSDHPGMYHLDLNKGEEDPRIGPPVTRGSGGPDAFGYRWKDNNEPGGPAFDWEDISDIGAPVYLEDDAYAAAIPLPFNFLFYGVEHNMVDISSNGFLTFGSGAQSPTNEPIPDSSNPNDIIAPFWDDLNPNDGGMIYYWSDSQKFIVQYDDIYHFGSGGGPYTFQVILKNNGTIIYQYLDMGSPIESATVGIENPDGSDGLQVAFNTDYIHNQLAIRIQTSPVWLITDIEPVPIPPLGSVGIPLTFDASDLYAGEYLANIVIISNDPDNSEVVVPVSLMVTGGESNIEVHPDNLNFGEVIVGGTYSQELIITNCNTGEDCHATDILIINDIVSSNPDFYTDPATSFPINLYPGEHYTLVTFFNPDSVFIYDEFLTIYHNDSINSPTVISLIGTAFDIPDIAWSPDSISVELNTGEITTEIVTIENQGGSNLVGSIGLAPMSTSRAILTKAPHATLQNSSHHPFTNNLQTSTSERNNSSRNGPIGEYSEPSYNYHRDNIELFYHHDAHCASSYYASGFDKSLINLLCVPFVISAKSPLISTASGLALKAASNSA